jgi:hypothetical protein
VSNANVFLITLANTFNDWRINDNNMANSVNNLRNSNYVKDNGSFIVANGSLQTTSTSGTGLSIGANALINGLTTMNTQITTGQASFGLNVGMTNANSTTTIAGNLIVGVNTIVGNLTVEGNQTIVGNTAYTTDTIILRQTLITSGNGQLIIEQGGTNGNAELKYLLSSNVWQVTSNVNNGYFTLLTTANIADSVSNNSIISIGSANAVEWAYNTAANAYAAANQAGGGSNAALAYRQANSAYNVANLAYAESNAAYNQANAAYAQANSAAGIGEAAYAEANTIINYLPLDGGDMTGTIYFQNLYTVSRLTANSGYLYGNYPTESPGTAGCIYTIGGIYVPNGPGSDPLGNMYGIGYTTSNTKQSGGGSTIAARVGSPVEDWGLYTSSAGVVNIFLDSDNGYGYFIGGISTNNITATTIFAGGLNVLAVAEAAYNEGNTAYAEAVSAFILAETAETNATYAYTAANNAQVEAVVAYNLAALAQSIGVNAYNQANSAYSLSTVADNQAVTALGVGENAYAKANSWGSPTQTETTSGSTTLPGGVILQWGQTFSRWSIW